MDRMIADPRKYRETHPKVRLQCVCLNVRSIVNELNIMVDDINLHTIGRPITESWANTIHSQWDPKFTHRGEITPQIWMPSFRLF